MFLPNAEVQLGYLYKIFGCNKLHTRTLSTLILSTDIYNISKIWNNLAFGFIL